MTFAVFADKVSKNIAAMGGKEVYVADISGDAVWREYLAAFPDGTNPMFRERTEHDCSCCKNFIRNAGNAVYIVGGEVKTIWEISDAPAPYDTVAGHLDAIVKSFAIVDVLRASQTKVGSKETKELMEDHVHTWDHFHGELPRNVLTDEPDTVKSGIRAAAQVLQRGLEELSASAVSTVLGLIDDNVLYRGAEHRKSVVEFLAMQEAYSKINDPLRRNSFIWDNVRSTAARFRNTVIGTLVKDLSEGVDLERAVRSFEIKVAPANYKRPKALITKKMVEDAAATLRKLGKEEAIYRRFARIEDVSVNNVLFVDNTVQDQMKDGIEGLLAGEVKNTKVNIDKATNIGVDEFMEQVMPKVATLDVLVENRHAGNFMSLTAPQNEDTGGLFRWNNDFGWTYDGDVTDSIKERVKRAGGKVDAKLRVSLAWYNRDDLDIHVYEPYGRHIYYGNRGGKLDVDMNVSSPVRDAVENVRWANPEDGTYRVEVNNFTKRESRDVGFELEVECDGVVRNFTYDLPVQGTVKSLELVVKGGTLDSIRPLAVKDEARSFSKWGIATNDLARVDTLMLSPNHWDDNEVGNKHWFFILKGCQNPEEARGIYNEFLNPALEKHRKVFEVLGSKTKCPPADEQLSGLGYSSTRKDTATVVAKGPEINRAYTINF